MAGKGAYLYDATGRRVKAVTPAGTTYYAYNSTGTLVWQYDQATAEGTDYIHLGKTLVASKKASMATILGHIDAVSGGTDTAITGWACASGLVPPIDVHVYVGGPGGAGTMLGGWTANVASEAAVQTACHSSGTRHRFSIPLSDDNRTRYSGQPIYVYGISSTGGDNLPLSGSGTWTVPPSTQAPAAPSAIHGSVAADASSVSVGWSASATAVTYTAQYSTDQGAHWTTLSNGAATTATLSNPPDGRYLLRVQACNSRGCSVWTTSEAVVVARVPATPGNLEVPTSATGAVGVRWASAAWTTSYQLEHSEGHGWTTVYTGQATQTTVNETDSATWYYRVKACNANGCSRYATSPAVVVTLPPKGAPTVTGGGTTTVGTFTIGWSAVAGATRYNIKENANGAGETIVDSVTDASSGWPVTGKGNGTYRYNVQACNSSGCGPWGNEVTVVVTLGPPVPGNIQMKAGVRHNDDIYTISWTAVPGATRYEILGVHANRMIRVEGGRTSQVVESGQLPAPEDIYRLCACNDQACSPWSGDISP
ncbi:chitinase N-terminal domain-containing protein [Kosakonia sp. S42]|uniref:chitinase N-terminal domain-containing protein n=1 Tax=Kosakonia sp. S42 TaxID=2767458 RepID=UPI00190ACFA4|nr:chitinase N-terminal domain-containing protein [Kosakonia sp. S42]MBK0018753.1 hypothetical protein [Kosakonia sp. S42]